MTHTLAALEFDRVLQLVAHFARTERGRQRVINDPPRFQAGAGARSYELAAELGAFAAANGTLSFAGLDDAELLVADDLLDLARLVRLVSVIRRVVEVRSLLAATSLGPQLSARRDQLPALGALLASCDTCLGPAGEILDSASVALARARVTRERTRQRIVTALGEVRRRYRHLSAPFTIRRERYCIPVPSGERQAVAGLVLDSSNSGATLFIEPLEVVEANNQLAEATATVREEEERILGELAARIGRHRDDLLRAAEVLAELDAFQARLLFGEATGGILIEPGGGARLRLVRTRHPLLDPELAELRAASLGEAGNTRPVVPLDLDFPEEARLLLLSGPNAGGKTVALKSIGVTVLMAHAGIPVLASPETTIPTLSRVWCHIGDEQNLFSDLSTFTGAMQATAGLLRDADRSTLVLYDELGSGTDPEEGAALAAALLEEIASRGCWAVATAHLVTVAAHLEQIAGAANASMGYDETTGNPTFALEVGLPGRSRGLAIAARSGVGERLLARARELLSHGFLTIDSYLERLQEERERLLAERETLEARQRTLEEARLEADSARARLDQESQRIRDSLAQEREALRRKAREKLDAALAELDRMRRENDLPGRRRVSSIRSQVIDLGDDDDAVAPAGLEPGVRVRLRGSRAETTVAAVEGTRVQLVGGAGRIWVDAASCEVIDPRPRPAKTAVSVGAGDDQGNELKILGMIAEEAREEVERFIDRALLAGVRHVRVVHGHGSGTLRRMVKEVLAHHPAVSRFAHPPQARGGAGVTEVDLA